MKKYLFPKHPAIGELRTWAIQMFSWVSMMRADLDLLAWAAELTARGKWPQV